jgi:hypothetical protein
VIKVGQFARAAFSELIEEEEQGGGESSVLVFVVG